MTSNVGSTIGGLLGGAAGSSAGPASVNTYYPDVGQNTQNYQNLLGNQNTNINTLQNTAATGALNNYNTAANNPYATAYQQGAGTAANAYNTAGNNAMGYGSQVASGAPGLQAYAGQVMQQGADPNSALYNQQYSNATNAANANNAANGVTGPWAAGQTSQAQQNFNQNWQQQQLQNSIAALNSGGSALNTASGLDTMANQLQNTGAGDLYTGAGLPYNTAQGMSNNQNLNLNDLISNLGGINNIDSSTMQSLLQYLSQGSGYGIQQNQGQQNATAAGASGGMDLGGLLGGAAAALF